MNNINGSISSIRNSQAISQAEIENAKRRMNSTMGQSMILGASLTVGTNGSNQTNMSSSAPSLNSSTSVGSQELQEAKNQVQNSGNSKVMF